MRFFIFLPTFLFFLYTLYRLVKDDHIFLRKNIKLEQLFDIAFIVAFVGLIFAQFIPNSNIFSLTSGFFGASLMLYLIGRYKKFPLGRLFDFFTLSFLCSLPIYFLLLSIYSRKIELFFCLLSAFIYFILALFFMKKLIQRVMNKTLKEGSLSIYFLLFFSLFSLVSKISLALIKHNLFLDLESVTLTLFLVLSSVLLLRMRRN